MRVPLKIGIIVLLATLLVLIRAFENTLFYDPLLAFFKGDYKTAALPKMEIFALHFGVFSRFFYEFNHFYSNYWGGFSE